jgi:hypothetical protein
MALNERHAVDSVAEILSPKVRVASWVLGVAAEVGATFALFLSKPGSGTVGLMIIGGIFLLMGVTGRGIRSVKFGDKELILDAVATARSLRSQGDEEGAEELVQNLVAGKTPPVSVQLERSASSSILMAQIFEDRVQALLVQFLADRALFHANPPGQSRFDSLIQSGTKTIAVEIRSGVRFNSNQVADILGGKIRRSDVQIDGLFVIVNCDPNDPGVERLSSALDYLEIPKLVWGWNESLQPAALRQGLSQMTLGRGCHASDRSAELKMPSPRFTTSLHPTGTTCGCSKVTSRRASTRSTTRPSWVGFDVGSETNASWTW